MPVIILVLLFVILFISLICSLSNETPFAFLITIFLMISVGIFVFFQLPETIDTSKDEFYKISIMKFEDGTTKQISILGDGSIKHIFSISDKIHHEDSILRVYRYKSEENMIDFSGLQKIYFEVISPNDEMYEEAKEKMIEIEII